ncbi:hypothetical protein DUNSADRAFT_11838 [Dunaliella salina]|uniref:EF-hand domain-containing protein n=1 Tax=Dunaliella salina TaxID=3046 RepID=A0ABQ7GCH2_DUNSA|nr:hypothetical protein DUNSADRAFT_11838 [Dunaliella salina]|eukprot:KAF5832301.1 hypothetical protein DUNSADRAFT_11838 [Dunaliella salina]
MGICQSAAAARPSCLSQVLEKQLVEALILAKQRDSENVAKGGVNIVNQLLLQFPAMRPGFLRVQELFALLAPEHQLHLPLRTLKEHAKTIGLDVEQEHLKPIFVFDDGDLLPQELILVFTIAYIAAGKESPSTQEINPDIKACLDIVEKAFLTFDSSSRGFLPADELKRVIKNAGSFKVVGSKHHHRHHPGMGKLLYQDLPCDKSGNVTFKEFLLRIQTLVMSEIVDMDEMQELQEFACVSRYASLTGERLSVQSRHGSVTEATREALAIVNNRRSQPGTPEPAEDGGDLVHKGDVSLLTEAMKQGQPQPTQKQLQLEQQQQLQQHVEQLQAQGYFREERPSMQEDQQEAGDVPATLESQLQNGDPGQKERFEGMHTD